VAGHIPRWFTNAMTFTNTGTSWARRRATTLIGHNMLIIRPRHYLFKGELSGIVGVEHNYIEPSYGSLRRLNG